MRRKYYYVLLILLTVISACKKDNNPQTFTESSYPLAVGNWWQYQLTSAIFNTDTFILRVDSILNAGPYTKYVCNYVEGNTLTPAGYFLLSDTSMYFIQPYGYFTAFPSFELKFPVAAGQYWQGSFPGDSIIVTSVVNSYSTYGHTYGPCYYTKEAYDLPHNFKVSNMILTPKVGLIEGAINFSSDTAGVQIQQSINLINYHIE
jgi:hypothetical protein